MLDKILFNWIFPVSYTHLDVYKRQEYIYVHFTYVSELSFRVRFFRVTCATLFTYNLSFLKLVELFEKFDSIMSEHIKKNE